MTQPFPNPYAADFRPFAVPMLDILFNGFKERLGVARSSGVLGWQYFWHYRESLGPVALGEKVWGIGRTGYDGTRVRSIRFLQELLEGMCVAFVNPAYPFNGTGPTFYTLQTWRQAAGIHPDGFWRSPRANPDQTLVVERGLIELGDFVHPQVYAELFAGLSVLTRTKVSEGFSAESSVLNGTTEASPSLAIGYSSYPGWTSNTWPFYPLGLYDPYPTPTIATRTAVPKLSNNWGVRMVSAQVYARFNTYGQSEQDGGPWFTATTCGPCENGASVVADGSVGHTIATYTFGDPNNWAIVNNGWQAVALWEFTHSG